MKSDDLKSPQTSSESLPAAFSMSSNKRNGAKFEENVAEHKEIVPNGDESETSKFRHIPRPTADDTSPTLPQQRSANIAGGTSAGKLLQSTLSLLNGAAQTARERLAARQVEKEARKRERELGELRSRLLTLSPEWQATQPHQPAMRRSNPADELWGQGPETIHPDVTSARPEMTGREAAAKDHRESTRETKRGQQVPKSVALGQVEAHPESQYRELALRRAEDEIKRKSHEAHVEQQARIKAEQELLLAQAARARAEEHTKRIAERAEAERRSRIKAEEERKLAERARLQTEDDFKRKIQEAQAEQEAKLNAANLARLNSDEEKNEEGQRVEQQTNLEGEPQHRQTKQARLKALEEFNLKVQKFEVEQQTRIKAEEEKKQTEAHFLEAKEEAERKAREAEAEQQARIKAEEERKQAEAALLKVKEEAERQARAIEAEHQARIKAEKERKQAELAVLEEEEEEAKRKVEEARAEHEARIKVEQELQLGTETALSLTEPEEALLRAQEKADRKSQEAQAEHRARLKAAEERQQIERALLKAEDDAKLKAREDELEHLARTKIEQELQLATTARIEAEAEAKRNAEEIESERQAKLEAERQRQQAEIALLRAEEEAEWRARQAEEEHARLTAELGRQHAEEMRLRTMVAPARDSIRFCPQCSRVFSGQQMHCLYDASRLVDQMPTSTVNRRLILKLGIAFLGSVFLAGVAVFYFSSGSSIAALYQDPPAQPAEVKPEGPVVGGPLTGKETFLPSPEYPTRAKISGISGKVTVAVVVDKQGMVKSVRALKGHLMLQASAVDAAKKAKFNVEKLVNPLTSGTITYNFKL